MFKNSLQTGGAEKQILLLANNMVQHDIKVLVVATNCDQDLVKNFSKEVNFYIIKKKKIGLLFEIRRIIKIYDIDICHTWDFTSSVIGYLSTRFSRVKFIDGSIRSAPSHVIFRKSKPLWLQKKKVRLFSLLGIPILSNSFSGLNSYGIQHYRKAKVIYNLFDKKYRKTERKPNLSGNIKIGMVANMRWKKDFLTFIKGGLIALRSIPELKFYLIGDGPDREIYEGFLLNNVHQEAFHFTGFVENVFDYVKNMDICVLCNDVSGEGLSNSIMEYMACGKPVIVTDMGGNSELVVEGETGFLISEKDAEALSNKIIYILKNPEKGYEMGKNGKKRIYDLCGVQKIIKQFEEYYLNLMKS